jgi:tetratricopeptide (TPR) repeat protein
MYFTFFFFAEINCFLQRMNVHIEALLDFLKEDPADAFSRYALALEYMKAGDSDKGRDQLQQLLEAQPEYLAAYYQLGKILEEKGEVKEAIEIFEKGKTVALKQGNMHTFKELNAAIDAWNE